MEVVLKFTFVYVNR